jgi:hypothetical protein
MPDGPYLQPLNRFDLQRQKKLVHLQTKPYLCARLMKHQLFFNQNMSDPK